MRSDRAQGSVILSFYFCVTDNPLDPHHFLSVSVVMWLLKEACVWCHIKAKGLSHISKDLSHINSEPTCWEEQFI